MDSGGSPRETARMGFEQTGAGSGTTSGEIVFETGKALSGIVERARIAEDGGFFCSIVTSNPAVKTDQAAIFAKDVASSAELFAMDEIGNVTQLSPHPRAVMDYSDEAIPWGYESLNVFAGVRTRVNMLAVIRAIERLTGERFVEVERLPEEERRDWYTERRWVDDDGVQHEAPEPPAWLKHRLNGQ